MPILRIIVRVLIPISLLFGMLPARGFTQVIPVQDTTKNDQVLVDFADVFEFIQEGDSTVQRLLGNVEMRQDSVYFYGDTAIIVNEVDITAYGNVLIQQGDSLSIFGDSLVYQGENKIADLYGDVVLINKGQKLFTDRLNYDLNTKVATYNTGALLTNDTTQLSSKIGYYFVNQDEAFFKDSVLVVDPDFELRSDTLKFNTKTQVVTFLGPTLITQEDSRIYSESGFYDVRNKAAEFSKNPQYQKEESTAVADTIRYDGQQNLITLDGNAVFDEPERTAKAGEIQYFEDTELTILKGDAFYRSEDQEIQADSITYDKQNEVYSTRGRSFISDPPNLIEADQLDYDKDTGYGLAIGDVIWQDTAQALTIVCAEATYQESSDYLKAFGGRQNRPLLISELDQDSLFMTADTLLATRPDSTQMMQDTVAGDSARLLLAFNDVRIFKSNMQAICDSLSYNSADSIFRLYTNPIMWADTSQLYADTVHIKMADNSIDRVFLYQKSFILNSPDEQFFNQVKGEYITAVFEAEEIRRMEVEVNAESVYYALDEEDAYLGVNQTACSEMTLYVGNNEVERILFLNAPEGKFWPMEKADHKGLQFAGFRWETESRPRNLADLFTPRIVVPPPPDASPGEPEEEATNLEAPIEFGKSTENETNEEDNEDQ
ncbi:MAG: OstA-like protein [Bacteroidota bacterium]